jgi:citrate lyase subunit beta/citryl-CoA lyase
MVHRTLLFVPGSRPERFDKALAAGAGAVIIDLEDAVAPADKEAARDAVTSWLTAGRQVIVRVNGAGTKWFEGDLTLAALPGVGAIMLPKTESRGVIEAAIDAGAQGVYPLIETAAGFAAMQAIATMARVRALVFGSIDFQLDLGMCSAGEDDLLPYRAQFVVASRAAGIEPPIDGVTASIDNESELRRDALRSHAGSALAVSCAFILVRCVLWRRRSRPTRRKFHGHAAS